MAPPSKTAKSKAKKKDEIKEALANGDLDAVKEWLGTKPKLDVPLNESGQAALAIAAGSGNALVCKALIEAEAEVDHVDSSGQTALHVACSNLSPEVVEVLLEAEADPNLEDEDETTPMAAALSAFRDIVFDAEDGPPSEEDVARGARCLELLVDSDGATDVTAEGSVTPLHVAAAAGCAELCAKLAEKSDAELTQQDDLSYHPLHWAAKKGHLEALKALLEKGAPADGSEDCAPPMAVALEAADDFDWGEYENPDGTTRTASEQPAACWAFMEKFALCALALVEAGAAVGWTLEETQNGALHQAAVTNSAKLINALLEKGADVKAANSDGRTPLHFAALMCAPAACECLLKAGADINAADGEGKTALIITASDGYGGVVPALLKAGADPHLKDGDGWDAFRHCCEAEGGNADDARALVEAGAMVDWKNEEGATPLHMAVAWNDEKLVRLMLEKGASVDAKDANGETPLHKAALQPNLAPVLFDLVEENKRRATAKDADGRTPLGVACGPCRRAIERALFFLGRYELQNPETPKHKSATCVILFAVDHGEEEDEADAPPPAPAAAHAAAKAPAAAAAPAAAPAAAKESAGAAFPAGPAPPKAAESTAGLKKGAKGAKHGPAAPPAAPPPPPPPPPRRLRDVALKIMRHKDMFEREVSVRKQPGGAKTPLDPEFVLPVLRTHEITPDDAKVLGGEYYHCLVMERAQEDLASSIAHSRMSFEQARAVATAVGRCVSHLHEANLLHTDIKPLNIVQTTEGAWKLIDLDAAAVLSPPGKAGAKTSTAYSPPEMFYRVPEGAPEGFGPAGSWAVKNWGGFAPDEKLPFEPVKAVSTFDIWAVGIITWELLMRQKVFLDDVDCNLTTQGDMGVLAEWPAAARQERLDRLPDGWAKALLQRLLQRDPLDRPPSMSRILLHPFFANTFCREAPALTGDEKHHFFLSHFQKNAGQSCMALKLSVCASVPGVQVWYDQDVTNKTETGMMDGVTHSRFFVLFLSKEVLARPFVQKEIAMALKLEKPIVLVRATDDRYGAARTVEELMEGAADKAEAKRLADAVLAPGRALADVPWYSEGEFREISLSKLLEAMGMHTPTGQAAAEGGEEKDKEKKNPAHEMFRRTMVDLAMGCRAPPLPAGLKHHVCIVHDDKHSAAECAMIKAAVEEAFKGASVVIPAQAEEALLEAVRASKCVLVFLTLGVLGPATARVKAVSEAVRLGRCVVLAHEMLPELGGTASFYDYIKEVEDERAKTIFNDATSIPWHRDPSFTGVSALKLLLEGLLDGELGKGEVAGGGAAEAAPAAAPAGADQAPAAAEKAGEKPADKPAEAPGPVAADGKPAAPASAEEAKPAAAATAEAGKAEVAAAAAAPAATSDGELVASLKAEIEKLKTEIEEAKKSAAASAKAPAAPEAVAADAKEGADKAADKAGVAPAASAPPAPAPAAAAGVEAPAAAETPKEAAPAAAGAGVAAAKALQKAESKTAAAPEDDKKPSDDKDATAAAAAAASTAAAAAPKQPAPPPGPAPASRSPLTQADAKAAATAGEEGEKKAPAEVVAAAAEKEEP